MVTSSKNSSEKYNFEIIEKIIKTICYTKNIKFPNDKKTLERIIIIDYWIANSIYGISKEELINKVLKNSTIQIPDFTYDRTFDNDVKRLKELGVNIIFNRKIKKYILQESEIGPLCKINNTDPLFFSSISLLQNKLPNSSEIISKGAGSVMKSDLIEEYQEKIKVNPLYKDVSPEILHKILDAITNRLVLKLFVKGNENFKISHIFHPFFIKEFENNLYVLGLSQIHQESSYTREIEWELNSIKKGIDFREKNIQELYNKLNVENNIESTYWIQTQIESLNLNNQSFENKVQKIIKQNGKLISIPINKIIDIKYQLEEIANFELKLNSETWEIEAKSFDSEKVKTSKSKELPIYNGRYSPDDFYLKNVFGHSIEELEPVTLEIQILKIDLEKFKKLSIVDYDQYKFSEFNFNSFKISFNTILNNELQDLLIKESSWIKILK